MACSLTSCMTFVDEMVEMNKRAEQLEHEGNKEDAQALSNEWEGASALRTLFLSVDSFVNVES